MTMRLLTAATVRDLRTTLLSYREHGETIALVPTTGALHQGHWALLTAAKEKALRVVVSTFVNPLQFALHEDLGRYSRPLDADQKL
jgi:pantoate--beta-alanine ligase